MVTAPAKKLTKKEKKAIEDRVGVIFYRLGRGVQFDVMDLGKISDAGVEAMVGGGDPEEAVAGAIAKYRRN